MKNVSAYLFLALLLMNCSSLLHADEDNIIARIVCERNENEDPNVFNHISLTRYDDGRKMDLHEYDMEGNRTGGHIVSFSDIDLIENDIESGGFSIVGKSFSSSAGFGRSTYTFVKLGISLSAGNGHLEIKRGKSPGIVNLPFKYKPELLENCHFSE